MNLIENPHFELNPPDILAHTTHTSLVYGCLKYFHYGSDGVNDRGWGCGYRTLQTICSWIKYQLEQLNEDIPFSHVPTISRFQEALVQIGDKKRNFIGSKEWIGCIEAAYLIEYFYKIHCRIIHARNIGDLEQKVDEIRNHFLQYGSPIMMGGDIDCSSKCLLGISSSRNGTYLLILDPHYFGNEISREKLQEYGWVKWQHIQSLHGSSFYNLCFPLLKASGNK